MSTTDLPGSSLLAGRYRLVERLGAGGMSVVWRGFDEVLGRQVAVKVLPPSTSTDPSFRRRLRAEAQAAARLSHPHITNVYDYGEAVTVDGEPVPYVVMELVDGESLAAVLARSRRLPWPAAVRISAEVSAALAAAHARGIVHRDVTPANVMLTPSGAKVVDFGISALIGENDIDPDGSLLGTPAYLAPERLEGGQVSPATDVYAVGLLIYRTLIGQLPWDVGTTTALLRAHQYTEPEPLPSVEGLPAAVGALIARCLEKRPDDRPSSAELAHVLAAVAAEIPGGRGFVPDWADNSEDTTILPSARSITDGLGRIRAGQARVAESQPGRGVAAVRGGVAAPVDESRSPAAPVSPAPVSPAPGAAIPIAVAGMQAAIDGQPIRGAATPSGDGQQLSAWAPQQPAPQHSVPQHSVPQQPVPQQPAPRQAGPRGSQAGSAPNGGRNSRFGAPAGAAAAAAAAAVAPSGPVSSSHPGGPALRPAAEGAGPAGPPPKQAGGSGTPPARRTPGSGGRPAGSGRGRAGRNQTARMVFVAGAVVALGAVTYAWTLAGAGGDGGAQAAPQSTVNVANSKCIVSYSVWEDKNGRFTASVFLSNRDTVPIKNWKLWWLMLGDQVVSGKMQNSDLKLDQSQGAVVVSSKDVLGPLKTTSMKITGSYQMSNKAPMVFQLDGRNCLTYVSSKPGEPSRPVVRAPDGSDQFGPVPAVNPAPGLSTKPNGVIVPIPLVTPTKKPSGGTPGRSEPGTLSGSSPAAQDPTDPDDDGAAPLPPPGPSRTTTPTPEPSASTGPPSSIPIIVDDSDDGT